MSRVKRRATPSAPHPLRLSGRTNQRLRERMLTAHPLCAVCLSKGIITTATQIDHVTPLHLGGTNDDANLQSICDRCHKYKTITERNGTPNERFDIDGYPIDESH